MPKEPEKINQDDRLIYEQDCENIRYQDKLFWSRFQTLSVIEGASIGVIFTKTIRGYLAIILAVGTLFIVSLISLVALKDRKDSKNFIKRMYEFETRNGASEINPDRYFNVSKIRIPFDSLIFTRLASVSLVVFNVYLILYTL